MATVKEIIEKLAEVPNQNAEVLVRHGWNPMVERHYTLDVQVNGSGEPVIVSTYRVTEDMADTEEGRDRY